MINFTNVYPTKNKFVSSVYFNDDEDTYICDLLVDVEDMLILLISLDDYFENNSILHMMYSKDALQRVMQKYFDFIDTFSDVSFKVDCADDQQVTNNVFRHEDERYIDDNGINYNVHVMTSIPWKIQRRIFELFLLDTSDALVLPGKMNIFTLDIPRFMDFIDKTPVHDHWHVLQACDGLGISFNDWLLQKPTCSEELTLHA